MSGLGGGRRTSQKNPAPKTNVHTTCPCSKKLLFYILFQCYFYCIILYLYLHFIIIFTQKIKQLLLILTIYLKKFKKLFLVQIFIMQNQVEKLFEEFLKNKLSFLKEIILVKLMEHLFVVIIKKQSKNFVVIT